MWRLEMHRSHEIFRTAMSPELIMDSFDHPAVASDCKCVFSRIRWSFPSCCLPTKTEHNLHVWTFESYGDQRLTFAYKRIDCCRVVLSAKSHRDTMKVGDKSTSARPEPKPPLSWICLDLLDRGVCFGPCWSCTCCQSRCLQHTICCSQFKSQSNKTTKAT